MKNILLVAGLTVFLFTIGCNGNNTQQQSGTAEQAPSATKEGDEEVGGKLGLNNGSKWQANRETTEGIQAMQKLTDDFIDRNDPDNKALSEALKKEMNTVLQKCTMTGEAHTQLHNYLLPLKEKIEELKVKTGTQSYGNIQSYLDNYVNYFQ